MFTNLFFLMIERINKKNNIDVFEFLKNNIDEDFYYTQDNQRIYPYRYKSFRCFLNNSLVSYCYNDKDIHGVLIVWKSKSNGIERNYLKLISNDYYVGKKLIQLFLWNHNIDLYVKLNKRNKFINLLFFYNFKFFKDRGREILLYKEKVK